MIVHRENNIVFVDFGLGKEIKDNNMTNLEMADKIANGVYKKADSYIQKNYPNDKELLNLLHKVSMTRIACMTEALK